MPAAGTPPGEVPPAEPLLEAAGLVVRFGGVQALGGASFRVAAREVVAFVGPNGSGKTTACNVVSGRCRPQAGRVSFKGERIDGRPAYEVARLGISRSFQEVRVFRRFTVLENVLFAMRDQRVESAWRAVFGRNDPEAQALRTAQAWLARAGLGEKQHQLAAELSFGQAKLLEIIRALCTRPVLLLLDEPAAGLSPAGLRLLSKLVSDARRDGTTLVFVEHDLDVVRQLSDRVVVFDAGRIVAEGTPSEIDKSLFVRQVLTGAVR